MTQLSIVSWASSESELDSLKARLLELDFEDYELVPAVGESFDRAINRILPVVDGEYVIYVNKDAEFLNGWLKSISGYISEMDKAFFMVPTCGVGVSFGFKKQYFIETPMDEGRDSREILYNWFFKVNEKYLVDFSSVDVLPVVYSSSLGKGYKHFYKKGFLDAEWNSVFDCEYMETWGEILTEFVHSFFGVIGYIVGSVMFWTNDSDKFDELKEKKKGKNHEI